MINFHQSIQVKFPELSKSHKKIAKYLLEYPQQFAIKPAGQIGQELGVSETTVIRFCYALEYSGFSELQKQVRESLLLPKSSLDQYVSNKLELSKEPHFFAQVMEQDCKNIQRTAEQIDEGMVQQAVDQLIAGEQVLICGLRSSFAAAHWLSFTLGLMRENVYLYKADTDGLGVALDRLNERTVFVAISFHRYLKETIHMAELAKKRGAVVIGITDSPVAPLSKFADVLLTISSRGKSTLDTTPALFSLLNAIVAKVSVQDKQRVQKRKQQYETIDIRHLFHEEDGA
ncbi:MurR/RpiR family transcriptional regulator [Bacillus rubiinfantis]|uniref:MurR/RpiR family transcriptional regulator n=1 Tax=Bacillus rubiinfantis TaxID=1499680 RepID=UPI0005A83440|nr:MurR/RpiR family transcriptional regulator [Bacillus rubiinfantis]